MNKALIVCRKYYGGDNKYNCDKCPIYKECTESFPCGYEALKKWQEKVEAAAEKVVKEEDLDYGGVVR